jgi:hypothetical protein
VVHAHHDGEVLVLGRSRDDDLLRAAGDVGARLRGVGEQPGRLDDDVGAEVGPGQGTRVALGEGLEGLAVDADLVLGVRDLAGQRPRIESYFSRWASVLLSVRSFAPTISMSAPDASTARKKLRPMRPKPLIPTRTVTRQAFRRSEQNTSTLGDTAQ